MANSRELYSMATNLSLSGSVTEPARDKFINLKVGQQSMAGLEFCPFKLIRKYPFMYQSDNSRQLHECMKNTIFTNRIWTCFYLLDPNPGTDKEPLLLVPTSQFEEYLNYVSTAMNVRFSIPDGQERDKFVITFGEMDTPLPRFIGHADGYIAINCFRAQINKLSYNDLTNIGTLALKHYKAKMDTIHATIYSDEKKKKKDGEKARLKRVERQKGYSRVMKRAQRYLGLRPSAITEQVDLPLPNVEWNGNMPVPFQPEDFVRFVCVDVEAWERNLDVVTEIGLAILDTRKIKDMPPGGVSVGYNWFSLIESHHFRIHEHIDKVNHRFVAGCPGSFNFGESYIAATRDMRAILSTLIGDKKSEDTRPIVIVGHDVGHDLKYLMKVGYNIWNVPHFLDEIDTKSMFQRYEKSPDGRGLKTMCHNLGIPGHNFHNAGNDAMYTLRAMIAMAVNYANQSFARQNDLERGRHGGSDPGEWSDGPMDDGGEPVKPPAPIGGMMSSMSPQSYW